MKEVRFLTISFGCFLFFFLCQKYPGIDQKPMCLYKGLDQNNWAKPAAVLRPGAGWKPFTQPSTGRWAARRSRASCTERPLGLVHIWIEHFWAMGQKRNLHRGESRFWSFRVFGVPFF